ncbi:uncharacterized protein LOC117328244 [Pecten maximus]|uniref:uncharacterized protein LOC117328244 n=1 Tax=Pecten maximus TaxID=6579 RepID=UPI001458D063|nr:uncharacterized protein LOC117328244 [Pecten maximus]XP_033741598.1 uncharacterized protein LOC117328244 [Pecten maximus]
MDDETIDWMLSDGSIDAVSGVPLSSVLFMLYYGFELKYFFLQISEELMTRYPLVLYDVGRSSVYLGGSCGHGFFLNSRRIPDLRDFDIVTILKKYDIRTECQYDKSKQREPDVGQKAEEENEDNRDFCASDKRMNVTCGSDPVYLNVESSEAGYVLLRKCRRNSASQVSLQQRYVSSSAVMKARFEYWDDAKMFIKQRYTGPFFTRGTADDTGHIPILSFVVTQGPAVSAFLTDRRASMTTTLHTDIVIALPYPGWPSQAREWLSRERKYGWPNETLRHEIQNNIGCMIVPVGRYGSDMEDFQWRVSFSRAEMLLSRSFTRVQRELVHLLKALDIGGSYHIINLVYRLIEDTPEDAWRSKNLATLVFTLVDQYIACVCERRLPHYFMPALNLMAKYQREFVEVNGRTRFIDDHLDAVLLPLHELRINPLDTLLNQEKYLSLPQDIRRRVFAPLVDEMKPTGSQNKRVYVDTLVSLAKAHLHHERVSLAYRYVQDAMKFSRRLTKDTDMERETDLHLTSVVCSYMVGDTATAMTSLQELEQLLNTDEQECQGCVDVRRSYYLMLYGRILFTRSFLPDSEKSVSLTLAREMYRRAMDTLVPDTTVYLDSINFFMRLGETDEVNTLITFLSAYLLSSDEREESVKDVIQQPDNTNEEMISEMNTQITSQDRNEEEKTHHSSATESMADISSRDSPTDVLPGEDRIDRETDLGNNEHIEVVYDRSRLVSEEPPSSWTPLGDVSTQFTTMFDDDDDKEDSDPFTTIPEEINNLDAYFIHRVALAKRYEKIGMCEKSNEMLRKLKEKLEVEHGDADRIFPLVVEASKMLEETSYAHDSTPEEWRKLFKDNTCYITYCNTDLPIVDDIIATLIRRKDGKVKFTHREALLHFQIQHFKMLHQFARAQSTVSVLESDCENSNRDECRWLLQLHKAYFGHKTGDDVANKDPRRDLGLVDGVVDEVVARIDQLMDAIKTHEIRNAAMDDIFNFSDY